MFQDRLRALTGARVARIAVRGALALGCFAIAVVLSVAPGPAFVFWILGFLFLGVGAGEMLLSVHAVQEWLRRRVPFADRLPRLRKGHVRQVLRHRWVRALETLFGHRELRARRRAARRRGRARRRTHPPT